MPDKIQQHERKTIILSSVFFAAVGLGMTAYGLHQLHTLSKDSAPHSQTTKHQKTDARGKALGGITMIYAASLIPLLNKKV